MAFSKVIFTPKLQLFLLISVVLALNLNTLFNQYALDDEEVFTKNTLVTKGINGIPKILSTDLLYGTPDADNTLSQARYRPLSLVIFALEYQVFGTNPFVSHLINILLFALLIFVLYNLLQNIFKAHYTNLAFIICLIFAVHPIHTEVIANVKSRDEIVTFIFLILTLISSIKYTENHSINSRLATLIYFFLALLTRESAVTFIAVVSLVLYFFFHQSIKNSLLNTLPLIAVFIGYMALRIFIVGVSHPVPGSIMDNPFLYASVSEAFSTKVFILIKYIFLLIYPFPLSCDYGFNQLPYISIFSFQFIISLLLIVSLILYAGYTFRRKSILSFSIFYFLITISLASNMLVDIGTPLSERLLFQPSLALCIVAALFYCKAIARFKLAAHSILCIVLLLFSVKTISRNADWKNNQTLFFADVISAPNSVRTNLYAASNYVIKANNENDTLLKKQDFSSAVYYGERSAALYHNYPDIYVTLGHAYFGLKDYFKAADNWLLAYNYSPSDAAAKQRIDMLSAVLLNKGDHYYSTHAITSAILYYRKSAELNNNVEAWYKLGGNYFLENDTKKGIEAWQNVISLSPNHPLLKEQFHN